MLVLLLLTLNVSNIRAVLYDSFSGIPATRRQVELFQNRNNTRYCLIDVKPCDENEWRRVDASCTNLKYPSRGMVRTPTRRILTPKFSSEYEPRKTKNDKEMPLSRPTRNEMLQDGKATDLKTTQLVSYFLLFNMNDVNSLHDLFNYVFNTTNCCEVEGKSNYICAPIKIPEDDPVHRFSGVRCQNLTRPQSYQYFGCVDFGTTQFARMVFTTPVPDLGSIYGIDLHTIDKIRTYSKGLLVTEIENGEEFPTSSIDTDPRHNKCIKNVLPHETRCHRYIPNGAVSQNVLTILFYRHHNYIAKELAKLNPCWTDDRIFYTAKDINIAVYQQIFFCELIPVILGRDNVAKEGLSCPEGFRDMYDENIMPQISDEYVYVNRWFHTIQETDLKLYDDDGYYLRTIAMLNITTRTGFLPLDKHMNMIFQGSFRQPGAKVDYTIDPNMGQDVSPSILFASDVATNDLEKGRLSGFAPYVEYREFCAKKSYKTFASLIDVMQEERIYRLTQIYDNVEDVDLMTGVWGEDIIPGGMVPYTVYCLMVEQLKKTIASDRHWYERPNRPHAFTFDQLKAVRKSTMAGVMCANAEGVTKIQLNAFNTISSNNPLTDCSSEEMGNLDFTSWQDSECKT